METMRITGQSPYAKDFKVLYKGEEVITKEIVVLIDESTINFVKVKEKGE